MFNRIMQGGLLALLLFSAQVQAASYNKTQANEIRRILQQANVENIQASLLIRRMEARGVPADVARDWSKRILKVKERKLPVDIAVDRLQQALIKNIKLAYIDKALDKLLNSLAWSNDLVVNKTLPGPEASQDLDEDEQALLSDATLNLEVAARQGYKQNELAVLVSRKGVDLEMAAELTKTLTLWTNYGVDNKRVLLSLKRMTRVGLSPDKVKDVRESVDSKIVADNLQKPADIAKAIWQEIRFEAGVLDAEHAYRTGMQRNPNSLKGTGGEDGSGSLDELNISDVDVVGESVGSGDGGGGSIDSGGVDPGAGTDMGDGGAMGGGESESGGGESSGGSESGGGESSGESYEGGGMMDDH